MERIVDYIFNNLDVEQLGQEESQQALNYLDFMIDNKDNVKEIMN